MDLNQYNKKEYARGIIDELRYTEGKVLVDVDKRFDEMPHGRFSNYLRRDILSPLKEKFKDEFERGEYLSFEHVIYSECLESRELLTSTFGGGVIYDGLLPFPIEWGIHDIEEGHRINSESLDLIVFVKVFRNESIDCLNNLLVELIGSR